MKTELALLLEEKAKRIKYRQIDTFFQDKGPFRRELYPKQLEFFRAGKNHSQRAFIAANRCGKTAAGLYEVVLHLTGLYPEWWEGKRFDRPIDAWIVSLDTKQMLSSTQKTLFGDFRDRGTGILPREATQDANGELMTWNMAGVPNTVGQCRVKHVSGGFSTIEFKTCEQGRESFQGAKIDVILLDEEPGDPEIASECFTRTQDKYGDNGIILYTFTPLLGFSEIVLGFLPGGKPYTGEHPENPSKYVVSATWEDVPHIDDQWKKEALSTYNTRERDARSKGIPTAGAGLIYQLAEENYVVAPFPIPDWWPRAYGLDFGWNRTASIWIAEDPNTGIRYAYDEHYVSQQQPHEHAFCIRERGDLPGVCDPAGGGASIRDGSRIIDEYEQRLGLELTPGDNSTLGGITRVNYFLESGKYKVFSTCVNLQNERRTYRWDSTKSGKTAPAPKQEDHALDAERYLFTKFDDVKRPLINEDTEDDTGWFNPTANEVTGY